MDQMIRDRFTPAILDAARERYGIAPDAIRLLDGFESHILEFEREGGAFILRLSHSSRRTPQLILGEMDWINYLWAGGAGVARALPSPRGELVEPIDDGAGGRFLAAAFVKARRRASVGNGLDCAPPRGIRPTGRPPARADCDAPNVWKNASATMHPSWNWWGNG